MAKKKKGGSVKGGRPAVLSLGKKVAKAPSKGKKVYTDARGRSMHRRISRSAKSRKLTYKQRTEKGY